MVVADRQEPTGGPQVGLVGRPASTLAGALVSLGLSARDRSACAESRRSVTTSHSARLTQLQPPLRAVRSTGLGEVPPPASVPDATDSTEVRHVANRSRAVGCRVNPVVGHLDAGFDRSVDVRGVSLSTASDGRRRLAVEARNRGETRCHYSPEGAPPRFTVCGARSPADYMS